MRRFHITLKVEKIGLLAIIFLSVSATTASAMVWPEQSQKDKISRSRYAAGRLIVKLTPQAADLVKQVVQEQERLPSDRLPVPILKEVSREYKVLHWKPMFPKVLANDPSGLGRVYILICDPSVDIVQAIQSFETLSKEVEYAQLDSIMEIQHKKSAY